MSCAKGDYAEEREDVLHFIEVKSGEEYELSVQSITPTKLSRLIKSPSFDARNTGFSLYKNTLTSRYISIFLVLHRLLCKIAQIQDDYLRERMSSIKPF